MAVMPLHHLGNLFSINFIIDEESSQDNPFFLFDSRRLMLEMTREDEGHHHPAKEQEQNEKSMKEDFLLREGLCRENHYRG